MRKLPTKTLVSLFAATTLILYFVFTAFAPTTLIANKHGSGQLLNSVDVKQFGAVGDDITNDLASFQAAAASGSKYVYVPPGTYLVDGPVNIADGQTWHLEGVTLRQTGNNKTMFSAEAVNDWALIGPAIIVGTRKGEGTAIGVYIAGSNRFRVDRITAKSISGWGFKVDSGDPIAPRGDQGQFNSIQAVDCYYGFQNTSGTGAEYCTLIAPMFSGNIYGMAIAAGNTSVIGGNIVDNDYGVRLDSGYNHAHGIFTGVNINHNRNYNLKADGIENGQTFNACHFYGDDAAGAGRIWFNNSKGVSISGGMVDALIQNDGTGANYLTDVMFPGKHISIAGTNPGNLYIDKCKTFSGPFSQVP